MIYVWASFHCPNKPRGKTTEFASGNTHRALCVIYDRIQVVVFPSIGEISRKVQAAKLGQLERYLPQMSVPDRKPWMQILHI